MSISGNFIIDPIDIQVCGYELVRTVNTSAFVLKEDITMDPTELNLTTYFESNVLNCSVTRFKLFADRKGSVPLSEEYEARFAVVNSTLTLTPLRPPGNFTFYLFGLTASGINSSRRFDVEFFEPVLDFIVFELPEEEEIAENLAPEFEEDITDKIYTFDSMWQTFNEIIALSAPAEEGVEKIID
jgi:hypothetical protein